MILTKLREFKFGVLAVGLAMCLQFLPYLLTELELRQGMEEVDARITGLRRDMLSGSHPRSEKSCTIYFSFKAKGQAFHADYRGRCSELQQYQPGDSIALVYSPVRPATAKPAGIHLSLVWLTFGSSVGILLSLAGIALFCYPANKC
jgi:hypothetical protein